MRLGSPLLVRNGIHNIPYIRAKEALLVAVAVLVKSAKAVVFMDVCKISETVVRTRSTKGLLSTLPNKCLLLCEAPAGGTGVRLQEWKVQ